MGIFSGFLNDAEVRLVGVEAAGKGIASGHHSATLTAGTPGVLHGSLSYLLQDADGQVSPAHSISAGLDYPGSGPEHAYLRDSGRARYEAVTDEAALAAFRSLAELEGIIPALESAHAFAQAFKEAPALPKDAVILINQSGRGDKDIFTIADAFEDPSWRKFIADKAEGYRARS